MIAGEDDHRREDDNVDEPNDEVHPANGDDTGVTRHHSRERPQPSGGTHVGSDLREDDDRDHGGEHPEPSGDEKGGVVPEDVREEAADDRSNRKSEGLAAAYVADPPASIARGRDVGDRRERPDEDERRPKTPARPCEEEDAGTVEERDNLGVQREDVPERGGTLETNPTIIGRLDPIASMYAVVRLTRA